MSFNKDIENLAETIFMGNDNCNYISISLGGIETSEQLFTVLCLILTRGIVYFYGEGLNLEEIPQHTLTKIFKKMHYAGIECNINILEKPKDAPTGIFHIYSKTSNDIKDHALHIITKNLYVLRFGLPYVTNKKCGYKVLA